MDDKATNYVTILQTILAKEDQIMAAVDDLNAAVTAMTTAVGNAVTEIQKLAAQIAAGGLTSEQAEAIAGQLNTLATNLQAAVTAGG